MIFGVYALGILLVLAGALSIATGAPIIHLEQGWTAVLAGAVGGSAGFVILVLGQILARMKSLQGSIERIATVDSFRVATPSALSEMPVEPSATERPPALARPVELRAAPAEPMPHERSTEPVRPEPVPVIVDEPAFAPAVDEEELQPSLDQSAEPDTEAALPTPPVEAPAPARAALFPARARPNFLATFLSRRFTPPPAAEPPAVPVDASVEPPLMPLGPMMGPSSAARTSVDLSSGWGEPEPAASAPHDKTEQRDEAPANPAPHPAEALFDDTDDWNRPAEAAAAEPEPEHRDHAASEESGSQEPQPVVTGRYNLGSNSYAIYSNGMIEVETETGVLHRFGSMQELSAFIEEQKAARV